MNFNFQINYFANLSLNGFLLLCLLFTLSSKTAAQAISNEVQLRASLGSASDGGGAWGFRLSKNSDWSGSVVDVSGGNKSSPVTVKASWNMLSEDSALPDILRLGIGFSQLNSNQRRIALSFSQEAEQWGWSVGSAYADGDSLVVQSIPTVTDNSVIPSRVIRGYNVIKRPWKYSAFGRGIFVNDSQGLRITTGADIEWLNSSTRQITAIVQAEKYFGKTPWSVSFNWEHAWLPKDTPIGRNSDKFSFNIRYEFTKTSSSGLNSLKSRSNDSTERAGLRETFYLKSLDNAYYRIEK